MSHGEIDLLAALGRSIESARENLRAKKDPAHEGPGALCEESTPDALHLTPREVAQVDAALDESDDGHRRRPLRLREVHALQARDHGLTNAELLAAAAIVAAEADERGMRHWDRAGRPIDTRGRAEGGPERGRGR